MNVYTYSDSSEHEHNRLLGLWQGSWAARGWNPRVLSIHDAKRHPRYAEMLARAELAPKELRAGVRTNYRKWLAFAAAGGGYLCDPAVINYGFAPQGYASAYLTQYHPDPVLLSCTAEIAEGVVEYLSGTESVCTEAEAFLRHPRPPEWYLLTKVTTFREGAWSTAPLVHYPDEAVRKFGFAPRTDCIQFVRNPG